MLLLGKTYNVDVIGILSILEDQPYLEVKRLWELSEKKYHSKGVQSFDHPNITFQGAVLKDVNELTEDFRNFAAGINPFKIEVSGFGCFDKNVIFLKVEKSDELSGINESVNSFLENRSMRIFDEYTRERWVPHITLAMDDLSTIEFDKAWKYFSNKECWLNEILHNLCLVKRDTLGKIRIIGKYSLG